MGFDLSVIQNFNDNMLEEKCNLNLIFKNRRMYFIYEAITDHYKKTSAARYENLCKNKGVVTLNKQNKNLRSSVKQAPPPPTVKQAPPPRQTRIPVQPPPPPAQPVERVIRQNPPAPLRQEPRREPPSQMPALVQYEPQRFQQQDQPISINNDSKLSKNEFMTMEMPERPIASTKKANFEEAQPQGNMKLFECPEGCGRSFNQKALEKHAKVCKKVFQEKRKEFCAAEQREIEELKDVAPVSKKGKQQAANNDGSKPKWALQSLVFRANIKKSKGIPLTPDEQQALKQPAPDMVQCNFCGRKFNKVAAQKHIPFCQKKSKKK